MGQEYELLQIESEQSPSAPKNLKKFYVAGIGAFAVLTILLTSLAVVSVSKSRTLEVQPDNTPASKRGAGLLLM